MTPKEKYLRRFKRSRRPKRTKKIKGFYHQDGLTCASQDTINALFYANDPDFRTLSPPTKGDVTPKRL